MLNTLFISYFEITFSFLILTDKPECAITQAEMDGKLILTCSTSANPPEVDFTWRIKNENDTIEENVEKKGQSSILTLESYVENFRTYLCFANNSVGVGIPCERDVTGENGVYILSSAI